jgi:hypothetical protein
VNGTRGVSTPSLIPLRIDDFGASSKRYERHRGKLFAYREVTARELNELWIWLARRQSACTLAITACWVERDGTLTPYPQKFPLQAHTIRQGIAAGVFEVACHGLTHCIPGQHVRPWYSLRSNRQWHREFIDALDVDVQVQHLTLAKQILEDYFAVPVTTLVPPGNAIPRWAVERARGLGYATVTCRARGAQGIVDDSAHYVVHDRDLVARGIGGALDRIPGRVTTVRAACSPAAHLSRVM